MKNITLAISILLLMSCSTPSSSYPDNTARLPAVNLYEHAERHSCITGNTLVSVPRAIHGLTHCMPYQHSVDLPLKPSRGIEALLAGEQTVSF